MDEDENTYSPADCLAGLPYFTVFLATCGHYLEFHTVAQVQPVDMEILTSHPCIWCTLREEDATHPMLEEDHLHVPYRRGDAAFRPTTLTIAEHSALLEMEKEMLEAWNDTDG